MKPVGRFPVFGKANGQFHVALGLGKGDGLKGWPAAAQDEERARWQMRSDVAGVTFPFPLAAGRQPAGRNDLPLRLASFSKVENPP